MTGNPTNVLIRDSTGLRRAVILALTIVINVILALRLSALFTGTLGNSNLRALT